jgi:anti-anti-sigma factor
VFQIYLVASKVCRRVDRGAPPRDRAGDETFCAKWGYCGSAHLQPRGFREDGLRRPLHPMRLAPRCCSEMASPFRWAIPPPAVVSFSSGIDRWSQWAAQVAFLAQRSRGAFVMSLITDPSSFGVSTTIEGQSTIFALRGRVENQAAFELGALLDAAIDQRPESLILDLSELHFMGASGMVAISNAERRLADLGSQLTVRSPSVLVNRLLGMMEMAEQTRLERALPEHGHLGPEDPGAMFSAPPQFTSSVSSSHQHRVTALPATPEMVNGALRLVAELARSCVNGADGVSVSLLRDGVLTTVAASDQTILAMDADQYSTGEGPCVDASLKGHWFHAESLDTETRWPSFTPRARELGIKSIMSSPLKACDDPVGALNIYSRTAATFDTKDQATAMIFAREASVILSDARSGPSESQMALRYKEALDSRRVITLATGVIMERYGADEDGAFTSLLRLSLHHGETLRARADSIVRSAKQRAFDPVSGGSDA